MLIMISNYYIKMELLVQELIMSRQAIRHPSEPYVHASAVFDERKKECRQCG